MFVFRATMYFIALITFLLLLSAAYTSWRVSRISTQYEPDGSLAVIDGVKLHYHFFPAAQGAADRPVLVFLHGASGNSNDTLMAFKGAFDSRYALLFVDRPGLGFSERESSHHGSLEGQARLVAGLLDHLKIEHAVVAGHSFGAAVTAVLGLIEPERVVGLAFIAPVSHPWPGDVNWYYKVAALPVVGEIFTRTLTLPLAERMAPAAILRVFAPGKAPERYAERINLPLLFRPHSFRANSTDIALLNEEVARHSKQYHDLSQPALIVTGTDDTVVWPSIHSEGLLRDLPNAELLVLKNGGHMPHHTHTDEIVDALERLVRRAEARAGREVRGRPEASREPA